MLLYYLMLHFLKYFNSNIDESFPKNGIFEFELLCDIGNITRNENALNQFYYVPQTINFDTDKDDFEQFMMSIIKWTLKMITINYIIAKN
jgi:hypothetical protein